MPIAETSPVRAVIYARVSSLAQRDRHTIASQISTLPAFVALRGWLLAKPADTYVDDGHTAKAGFLLQRAAFTRLMADAARGEFDVVVVVDLDRLTRSEDLKERGEVLGAFQRAGVQLAISATGQVLDLRSSVGDLMSGLGTFFAAEANRKHRERITRGKDEAIRKGKKPAGPTPFGYVYDRTTGQWGIDPELGPIVVEIFTRVSKGESCRSIAYDLQARGVPTSRPSKSGRRQAGMWILERVHHIARSRTYLGTWVADKSRKLEVPVPRIVTDELHREADRALLRAGRRGRPRTAHRQLLQAISKCGLCGARIGCASTNLARGQVFYYVCTRRRRPRTPDEKCSLPMRQSDVLDAEVWRMVADRVVRDEHLERALSESEAEREQAPDPGAELPRLNAQLRQMVRAEEVLLERFGRGLISEASLDKELQRLTDDRGGVERAIAEATEAAKRWSNREEEGKATRLVLGELRNLLRFATQADRYDILRAIVARDESAVVIGPELVRVRLSLAAPPVSSLAQADGAVTSSARRSASSTAIRRRPPAATR